MRNWLQKIMNGRYGMYGFDMLSRTLLILWFGMTFVNMFFNSIIVYAVSVIPGVIFFFRYLSKNIAKRTAENKKFASFMMKIGAWFKFQWQKITEIRTHRYIRCKQCKALLRVPRKPGKHTAVCPKCQNRFEARIIL